ncbi:MAG: GNAT family N-acetyltransferase [Bacteriovorax sp.]|nr:GNAT family N-acetyltransferase [Bacteriovorax sp.]
MPTNNFALTTLSQNPEYFEEVIRLIEEEFHYSDEHSYEKDFAPLVDPLNFENCYFYIDGDSNTVAAHLAICIRTLVKADAEIKIALIGGIVTSKKYRGKNLFKNLMNHVIQSYEDQVALFILWSDIEGLYEKFQFYRTGGLIETGKRNFSASERPSGYEKTKFSLLSEKEFKTIVNLYLSFNQKYFFTIKREDKDWSIIRDMNSIDLYVKRNSLSEIERYFCINKGRDLSNIIHEISCRNLADYPHLIKELENFKVWLPETETENIFTKEIFYTAFMKLGSITLLNEFLKKISNEELTITKMDDDIVNFQFKGKDYNVSSKDFLQYLFGPKSLEEFTPYRLSIYITGADSI